MRRGLDPRTFRRLLPVHGGYRAVVLAAAATIALLVVAGQLLPTVNEVGTHFPASLLWQFRLSSLLTMATLWSVLGVTLTGLVGRVAGQERRAMAAAL